MSTHTSDVRLPRINQKCWKCRKIVRLRSDGAMPKHRISRAFRSQHAELPVCSESGKLP